MLGKKEGDAVGENVGIDFIGDIVGSSLGEALAEKILSLHVQQAWLAVYPKFLKRLPYFSQ